jgi:hypothetical protein
MSALWTLVAPTNNVGPTHPSETRLTTSLMKRALAALLVALAVAGATRIALLDWRPTPTQDAVVTLVGGHRTPGQPKRLVVYVGAMGRGVERAMPVLRQLMSEPQLAGADLLTFDALAYNFTPGPAQAWATRLRAEIDAQWIRAGGYDDVVLSGASLGSLLVRQAFVESLGRDPRYPRTVDCSDRVSRIVLLAGIGRGIDLDALPGRWRLLAHVGRWLPYVRRSIVYDQSRGSESIAGARIALIRYFGELADRARTDSTVHVPTVVQVLGDRDEVVTREDNIDFDQFPNAYYLYVPRAHHGDIMSFGPSSDSILRYTLIREAFTSPRPTHDSRRLVRSFASDSIQRVIFLLHGLRSTNDNWVRRLGPVLRERLPNAEVVESSYGLTSLLGFVLPTVRRRERVWLQDQYAEALARHPLATVDVIAHSNGTYILGESLAHLPSMQFGRVVLLSSVLPADYPWRERRTLGQVGVVRNDRVADDRVVALMANSLHGLGMNDVGTSGWQGFDDAGAFLFEPPSLLGGHGATVSEDHLRDVVEFMATDARPPAATASAALPTTLRWASGLAPWIAFLLAASFALSVAVWLWRATATRRGLRLTLVTCLMMIAVIALDVF